MKTMLKAELQKIGRGAFMSDKYKEEGVIWHYQEVLVILSQEILD